MTTIKATVAEKKSVGGTIYRANATGGDAVGIASVEQTTTSLEGGGVNVITVTKTNGQTSTFEVRNGADGLSATVDAEAIEGGYRLTITDKNGTEIVDVLHGKDGDDGHTPVKGTDYWTETDKTEIINAVLANLPAADGNELPSVTESDDGKHLVVSGGTWTAQKVTDTKELPVVTTEDDGKHLVVNGGVWTAQEVTDTKELPVVSASDNGKLLQVVDGAWSAVAITDGNNVAY